MQVEQNSYEHTVGLQCWNFPWNSSIPHSPARSHRVCPHRSLFSYYEFKAECHDEHEEEEEEEAHDHSNHLLS